MAPWLLRSPPLLSVTPVEPESVNTGRFVVSELLLKPKKLSPGYRTIEVDEESWESTRTPSTERSKGSFATLGVSNGTGSRSPATESISTGIRKDGMTLADRLWATLASGRALTPR
ncbi:hypothetical protein [Methanopyrus kandleri]